MIKKILVVSDVHFGGEWIANQRLFSGIKKRYGINIHLSLIGFIDSNNIKINNFNSIKIISHCIYAKKPFSYAKKLFTDFRNLRQEIREEINIDRNIEYIWCTYYLALLASLGIKRGVKTIYSFHGFRGTSAKTLYLNINYRSVLTTMLEYLALNFANIIIAPSNAAKKLIQKRILHISFLPTKREIQIISNSVESIFFREYSNNVLKSLRFEITKNKKSKIIIYSGRFVEGKGIKHLVSAFNVLSEKNDDLFLILAYPSPEKDSRFIIHDLGINRRIMEIENPSEKELSKLYQISDVLVLASDIEMAPLVVIEAFASGTPVIGTKVGNIPELLSQIDNNLILENNKPEEIVNKLEYFFHLSKKEIREIKKRCKEVGREFSVDKSVSKFTKVLNKIKKF